MSTEPDSTADSGSEYKRSVTQPTEFFQHSEHPLAEMYRERVEKSRDLVGLITDASNARGTGKSTLAIRLADGMDRTEEGLTPEKGAIDPPPLIDAYTQQPKGSGLVLDESEVGLDKYRSTSGTNKAIRELVSTGRIQEKYLVLNAPADHLVDKDLKSLVDVWVLVQERGFANVYRMDWNPHAGHELTVSMGTLEWDPIPPGSQLHEVYEDLTEEKEARLAGEEGEEYIKRSEADERIENAREEIHTNIRNKHIVGMVEKGLGHKEVADIVDLSRSRISQILAEEA